MFIEFNNFISESSSGKDFLLFSSRGGCSPNFIVSHLLVNASRTKKKVRLFCLGESRQFYSLICQRAGVSVQNLEESGMLRSICAVSTWKKQISSGLDPTLQDPKDGLEDGEQLVIVDDLLPLLDLVKPVELLRFVRALKLSAPGMIAVGIRTEDHRAERMMQLLQAMSSIWVEVHPLNTGYSKELHGVLEMWSFKADSGKNSHKRMHYRVTERGAKLLIIGGHTAIVS